MVRNLINKSIDESAFPYLLKFADVSAFFLTWKVMQGKLQTREFTQYLIKSVLTEPWQKDSIIFIIFRLDFVKDIQCSCQTTLLRMIQDWKSAIDNGNFVGSIALDLSKTFDCLPHGFLMVNLHAYGVEVSACKVLCSYLHDRHHSMKMCDVRSDWCDPRVNSGPLLFNIFISYHRQWYFHI